MKLAILEKYLKEVDSSIKSLLKRVFSYIKYSIIKKFMTSYFFCMSRQLILKSIFSLHTLICKRETKILAGWYGGSKKIRCKCFMQVRDEIDIIEDWIRYYLYLFGEGNVHILDHLSTDGTEKILEKYRGKITVRKVNSHNNKGDNLINEMKRYKNECDFAFFLDSDEFIVLKNSVERNDIIKELRKIDRCHWGMYKFKYHFVCSYKIPTKVLDPLLEIIDFHKVFSYRWNKCFLNAPFAKSISHGNHLASSYHFNPYYLITNLVLVHYQTRSFEQFIKRIQKQGSEFIKVPHKANWPIVRLYKKMLSEGITENYMRSILPPPNIKFTLLVEKIKELRILYP